MAEEVSIILELCHYIRTRVQWFYHGRPICDYLGSYRTPVYRALKHEKQLWHKYLSYVKKLDSKYFWAGAIYLCPLDCDWFILIVDYVPRKCSQSFDPVLNAHRVMCWLGTFHRFDLTLDRSLVLNGEGSKGQTHYTPSFKPGAIGSRVLLSSKN